MIEYPTLRLGQVARLFSGGTPSKTNTEYWNGTIPWLTPKDMGRWEGITEAHVSSSAIGKGTRLAPENASFVAVRGMSLHNEIRVVRSLQPIAFNQDIKAVVARPGYDARFLYYVLTAAKATLLDWVSAAGHGTGVLATDQLLSLRVPDVPILVQHAIASVVGDIDDKIEINRRKIVALEGMAQAIFRDWFIDFGPVRRKLEGATDPIGILGGLIVNPAHAAGLAGLFPTSIDAEGLPFGWTRSPLETLLNLAYGKALPKTLRTEGNVPVYGSGGIGGTHNSSLVTGPGVIVGRKGTVGSLFWEPRDFFPIDTVFFVQPRQNVSLHFLWQLLQTLGLETMNTDAAVPGLNRNNAHRLDVVRPPRPILDAFGDLAAVLRSLIDANDAENSTLAETRDYLLPRLMSGKIHVADGQEMAA